MATLVAPPMCSVALPIWSSARDSLPAHSRSPVMKGRLRTASTHSSSPDGEKLTAPDTDAASSVVPLSELSGVVAGQASVPQGWLNRAWLKLVAAAQASPALREAHQRELSARRS